MSQDQRQPGFLQALVDHADADAEYHSSQLLETTGTGFDL
jgi:hypothetical protein